MLLWANVSLISDCQTYYKDRFKPGMMCAGEIVQAADQHTADTLQTHCRSLCMCVCVCR